MALPSFLFRLRRCFPRNQCSPRRRHNGVEEPGLTAEPHGFLEVGVLHMGDSVAVSDSADGTWGRPIGGVTKKT
ncbi:hypothetical protein MRX96_027702 [Rhipicephalus microplus]